jgi:nucleoside-diphosphate-sugar epimerase
LLAPELIRQGYEVIGLDTGFYKERTFYRGGETTPLTLAKDLRHVGVEDLKDVDAVVHMAELFNDPPGQRAPTITYEINHKRSVHLAELALKAGVKRFVYMFSCSSLYIVMQHLGRVGTGLCKRRRNSLRFSYWEARLLELHRPAKAPTDNWL